jgi:hypothetical protein
MNEHEIIEALCAAYGSTIENIFLESIAHFYERHHDELFTVRPITKASLINDYIYEYLKRDLQGAGCFEFIERGNGRYVGYDSKILIRIKKLDKSRRPTINKTRASTQFNTQADIGLIKRAKNIYLGYVLNTESGNIDEVAFSYPSTAGVIAWTINVADEHIQQTLDLNIAPFEPDGDKPQNEKKDRLKPKTRRQKRNTK